MKSKIALLCVLSVIVVTGNATNSYATNTVNPSRGSTASDCARFLGGIKRTLGFEWEVETLPVRGLETIDPIFQGMARHGAVKVALARSNFRKLFAFYGKNSSGQYIQNLIPQSIVKLRAFQNLRRVEEGVVFEDRGGETFLMNWETMPLEALDPILKGLFNARGEYNNDLQIRKVPSAWIGLDTEDDQRVPDVVAEEWRDGFAGLEFPMHGFTDRASEIRSYLGNLWIRLGFFTAGELQVALDQAAGHVHWVADIQSLPSEKRQDAYEAIIGFWGDANDSLIVTHSDTLRDKVLADGTVSVSLRQALGSHMNSVYQYFNESITVLTRRTYKRLSANSSGVIIDDRENDLDTTVDPNIPPVFKELLFGLRGIYGQSSLPPGNAIPKVGIEARGLTNITESIASLPKVIEGTNRVDVEQLFSHRSHIPRGLLSSVSELRAKAESLGLAASFMDDLEDTVYKQRYKWRSDVVIAHMLLPLTDWLSHPLVERNLNAVSASEKAAAQERYNKALKGYVRRLNELARARKEPFRSYQPDWSDELEEFQDGYNRVYSRIEFPELGQFGFSSKPDMWFLVVVQGEAARFIAESKLSQLLKMP